MKRIPAGLPESIEPLLDDIEITTVREGLIDAYVPLELIITEDVPVDNDHVDELVAHFRREALQPGRRTGQISPASLSHIPSESRLPITDGFHRTATVRAVGAEVLFSTIRPDSSWEDVMDLRIVSATSHREVRFSRVVEWIQASWRLTDWAKDIEALQAFTLALNPSLTGRKLGLDDDTAKSIREWVDRKCQQWDLKVGTVHTNLQTAKIVDPDLIREAREGKGKGLVKGILTPAQVRAIGSAIPNNFPFQRLVAEVTKNEGLPAPQVKTLASLVSAVTTTEEVRKIIDSRVWRQLTQPVRPSGRPNAERTVTATSPEITIGDLRHEITVSEITIAKLGLENTILRGRYLVPPLEEPKNETSFSVQGYDKPNKVNGSRTIEGVVDSLDSFKDSALSSLKQAFGENEASRIFEIAKQRILKDVEDGALSFVRLDKQILAKLLSVCLNNQVKEGGNTPLISRRGSPQAVISIDNIDAPHLTPFAIDSLIPELPANERTTFILKAFFQLSNSTIAQMVQLNPVLVEESLKDIAKKVSHKAIAGRRIISPRAVASVDTNSNTPAAEQIGITAVETEVLSLITLGFTNKQIAMARIISEETVKSHIKHLLEKTGCPNRSSLVAFAYENGILERSA